jgi:hypothetical protein
MITLSIDITKIDKSLLKKVTKKDGSEAVYLNLILWDNKDGVDQYGNKGTVKQSLSKEQREEGIKVDILGNYKESAQDTVFPKSFADKVKPAKAFKNRPPKEDKFNDDEFDNIPF